MVQRAETFKTIRQLESPAFVQQEQESIGLYTHMKGLGIWEKMKKIGKKSQLFVVLKLPVKPLLN